MNRADHKRVKEKLIIIYDVFGTLVPKHQILDIYMQHKYEKNITNKIKYANKIHSYSKLVNLVWPNSTPSQHFNYIYLEKIIENKIYLQ